MSNYRESQVRIEEAEAALRDGDESRARTLYREAAGLQRAFVESLPVDRVRTRSIYGLSVATLLYRAGDLDEVERLAHQLLAEPWIEAHIIRKAVVLSVPELGLEPESFEVEPEPDNRSVFIVHPHSMKWSQAQRDAIIKAARAHIPEPWEIYVQ